MKQNMTPKIGLGGPRPIPLQPKFPVFGTHLQTIHMTFRKDHPDVSHMNATPIRVPMDDGTGDILTGVIHTPEKQRYPGLLVVAGHGFGGEASSAYMRWLTKFFYDQDIAVCRLNARGAGDSRQLCREEYNGARGEDLIRLWAWLHQARSPQVPFQVTHSYFAGTSLSGSILANALAKIDSQTICAPSDLDGVMGGTGICFAFDMPAAARKIHSADNWPYLQYLLGKIKPLFAAHPTATAQEKARIADAKTVIEIDDIWTAPKNGFATAFEFYAHASSSHWVPKVKRPMRVVATMDDPWISPQGFLDADWSNPLTDPRLFDAGGHCGLWEAGYHYQRHFREAYDHLTMVMDRI